MSQDAVINGTTYPGVESISLQDSEGNTRMYFPNAVRYVPQTLTEAQKAQARENIGAVSETDVKSSLPKLTMVGTDADGVEHTWTIYGS